LSPFQTPANTPTVLLCRLLRKRLLLGTLYHWRSHHRWYLRHRPRKSRSDPLLRSFLMFSLSITPLVAVIFRAVAQCRVGVVQHKTIVAPAISLRLTHPLQPYLRSHLSLVLEWDHRLECTPPSSQSAPAYRSKIQMLAKADHANAQDILKTFQKRLLVIFVITQRILRPSLPRVPDLGECRKYLLR
jgi:hypothetical protein